VLSKISKINLLKLLLLDFINFIGCSERCFLLYIVYRMLGKIHLCVSLGAKFDDINLARWCCYESQSTCFTNTFIAEHWLVLPFTQFKCRNNSVACAYEHHSSDLCTRLFLSFARWEKHLWHWQLCPQEYSEAMLCFPVQWLKRNSQNDNGSCASIHNSKMNCFDTR
jgi:hypothetical protein